MHGTIDLGAAVVVFDNGVPTVWDRAAINIPGVSRDALVARKVVLARQLANCRTAWVRAAKKRLDREHIALKASAICFYLELLEDAVKTADGAPDLTCGDIAVPA